MTEAYPKNGHLSSEEIDEMRARVWPDRDEANGRKAYDPHLIAKFGGDAGILLGQLIFWTGKSKLEGGWLWKKAEEIRKETGLSEYRQKKARKLLKARGVLEEQRVSRRQPMHFRVDLERLAEILGLVTPRDEYPKLESDTEYPKLGADTQTENLGSATESESLGSGSSESTSRDNLPQTTPESPPLQGGGDGSASRTAPLTNEERSPLGDGRDYGTTSEEKLGLAVAPELLRFDPETDPEYADVVGLLRDPESDCGRLARKHLAGKVEMERLLEAVSFAKWGSFASAELYRARVEQALATLRVELVPEGITG